MAIEVSLKPYVPRVVTSWLSTATSWLAPPTRPCCLVARIATHGHARIATHAKAVRIPLRIPEAEGAAGEEDRPARFATRTGRWTRLRRFLPLLSAPYRIWRPVRYVRLRETGVEVSMELYPLCKFINGEAFSRHPLSTRTCRPQDPAGLPSDLSRSSEEPKAQRCVEMPPGSDCSPLQRRLPS